MLKYRRIIADKPLPTYALVPPFAAVERGLDRFEPGLDLFVPVHQGSRGLPRQAQYAVGPQRAKLRTLLRVQIGLDQLSLDHRERAVI